MTMMQTFDALVGPGPRWIGLGATLQHNKPSDRVRRRIKAMRTYFYVAYAGEDASVVRPIVGAAAGEGHLLWLDNDSLNTAAMKPADMKAAIRGSRAVLMFCSRNAYGSRVVQREIAAARRMRKIIVPVMLQNAQPPNDLLQALPFEHALYLSDRDFPESLFRALDALTKGRRWHGGEIQDAGWGPVLVVQS